MSLLGQLIYTSFAKVGFQARTSAGVPAEICQKFIEHIVYQNWDSYNPPSADYRAAYLYQFAPDQTLFGWLYNDGTDDFGRSHVPYFVCYYWAGALSAVQLKSIFTCLLVGPIAMLDRFAPPDLVPDVALPGEPYKAARPGVGIFSQIQEQGYLSIEQGKLFRLFVSEDTLGQSLKFATSIEIPAPEESRELVSTTSEKLGADSVSAQAAAKIIDELITRSEIESYQQILLSKAQSGVDQPQLPMRTWKSDQPAGWRRAIVGIAALLALSLGGVALLRLFPSTIAQPSQNSIHRDGNPTLAKTLLDTAPVWSIVLSPDQQTVIGGGANQRIKFWNIQTGSVLKTYSGHTDVVRSLVLTPDGETLISGSGDRTIKIWDVQTNELLQTLNQASPVWSLALSPDGKTLFSGGEDGVLKVWHFSSGELLQINPVHQGQIFSIVISPDGKTVATGSIDRTIKLWNARTGALLRTITGHADGVRALAFSPDGKTLASASWDKTLKLWNWQTGDLIRTFEGHRDRVVDVAFSPDGQTLISGSVDHRINVWAAQDGTLERSLGDHTDWVLSLAIKPKHNTIQSDRLISSSKDQTIRIWQFH